MVPASTLVEAAALSNQGVGPLLNKPNFCRRTDFRSATAPRRPPDHDCHGGNGDCDVGAICFASVHAREMARLGLRSPGPIPGGMIEEMLRCGVSPAVNRAKAMRHHPCATPS
jgi:hypothetical protein